jgi:hypothetical protein
VFGDPRYTIPDHKAFASEGRMMNFSTKSGAQSKTTIESQERAN